MSHIFEWSCVLLLVLNLILLLYLLKISSKRKNERIEQSLSEAFRHNRLESAKAARSLREEVSASQHASTNTLVRAIGEIGQSLNNHLSMVTKGVQELIDSNETRLRNLHGTIDTQLTRLQEGNEKKLDQMRQTVDEKLHSALEKRLGESFNIVSERLEAVQQGLGEMKNLATGVGDLKRVLTNVKARGTWGEVQLEAILEQVLTPDQYDKNVRTRETTREKVEYAIRLPGRNSEPESCVWLPIDSKFPQEDYLRLLDAIDKANPDAMQKATSSLVRAMHTAAKEIRDKYLNPPRTTDFAIMFLPTEGLYSELLRQPGQVEKIQQSYRVVIAGPTTLAAILNSLRIGFHTLAIERRSSEVWKVLAAIKTEFGKFGGVLATVRKQLNAAANTIDQTDIRARAMERKLRDVEQLPARDTENVLGLVDSPYSGKRDQVPGTP
ncbi:MAG: DNA recombination protein RmuC [Desulfatiglans sp.]|jgi:DNA recombination protein RmuC|nr:DNA recombination protein RmuC [Thermodesulfobacteriota bacterium]MEE4353769.1 DNA recombination protein RmuC [Desulfatiglans sp.]